MGDLIQFVQKDDDQFRALLESTLKRLDAAGDALLDDVFNLAMRGPWRTWSDAQPVGARLELDSMEALKETGDDRLTALYGAYEAIQAALHNVRGRRGRT
jgi:hypothetical protein